MLHLSFWFIKSQTFAGMVTHAHTYTHRDVLSILCTMQMWIQRDRCMGWMLAPQADLHELLFACQSLGHAQTHIAVAAETVSRQGNASTLVCQRRRASAARALPLDLSVSLYRTTIRLEQLYHGAVQGKTRRHHLYSHKTHSSGYFNFHLFMRNTQCANSFTLREKH